MLCDFLSCHYDEGKNFDSLWATLMGISIICSQGNYPERYRYGVRILIISMLLGSLVLNAAYTADLVSVLFLKKVSKPFSNLNSLYHGTDLLIGTVGDAIYENFFQVLQCTVETKWNLRVNIISYSSQENIGVRRKLYDSRFFVTNTVSEGIQKVSDENVVFVWESDSMYFELEDTCSLQMIPMYTRNAVFYFREDYPYSEILEY